MRTLPFSRSRTIAVAWLVSGFFRNSCHLDIISGINEPHSNDPRLFYFLWWVRGSRLDFHWVCLCQSVVTDSINMPLIFFIIFFYPLPKSLLILNYCVAGFIRVKKCILDCTVNGVFSTIFPFQFFRSPNWNQY